MSHRALRNRRPGHNQPKYRQHRRNLFFENLEVRRVPDATALLSTAGVLTIEGTEEGDQLS